MLNFEESVEESVNHVVKQMFWDYFSYNIVGQLELITGMINSIKYSDVFRHKVLLEMRNFSTNSRFFL